MDELLTDPLAVALTNFVFFGLGSMLALLGPWPRSSWWPARTIWALASVCLALGVIELVAMR